MSSNIHNLPLDSSLVGLNSQSPERMVRRGVKLPKLNTEQSERYESVISPDKRVGPKKIPKGYEIAQYEKAEQYWYSRSYSRKVVDPDGQKHYQTYQVCDNLEGLKQYGLGVYLYLQFIKQLLITCVIISAVTVLPLYVFYNGTGLSAYTQSYNLTLALFSQGNLQNGQQLEYLVVVSCDVLSMIILFGFYIRWRSFHTQMVEQSERDHTILNPAIYALSITGFDKDTPDLEKNLKGYFDSMFRGAYQVEVIHNFKRNFNKFIDLEEQIQKIQKQKQVIKQTDKSNEELIEYEKELDHMEEQLAGISYQFDPIQAIVHFRNLKAKYSFINLCKKYALVNKLGYKFRRCICCMPGLPQRQKFLNKNDLLIQNLNLSRPDQINWDNTDISTCSRIGRWLVSIILLLISIFITSSLIAFCTLYVSSTASCSSFDSTTTLDVALAGDEQTLYCFCSSNYASIFTDSSIQSACANLSEQITITNIVQIAASVVSAVSNLILIVIVTLIAEYLLKPDSKPKEYTFIFVAVFLSNYINSTILPLILNGDINGFVSVSYLTFVSFINFDTVAIFKDFDRDWYAIISPYYTNFFIIGSITPLIQLFVFFIKRRIAIWLTVRKCRNDDPNHPAIQKEANSTIIMFPFDFPTDVAVMCLQLFMCFMYSGLIPLSMPIFTFGLFCSYFCKRYLLLNYTVRIPADESINGKVVNLLPFIILVHGLLSIWSHTAQGIYDYTAFSIYIDLPVDLGEVVNRAITDIIQLAATGLILVWIIMDWTIVAFFIALRQACKDQLQLPLTLATLQNQNYADRAKKSNALVSYKLSKNPVYGHAYKAYRQLMKRVQRNEINHSQSSMRDETVNNLKN